MSSQEAALNLSASSSNGSHNNSSTEFPKSELMKNSSIESMLSIEAMKNSSMESRLSIESMKNASMESRLSMESMKNAAIESSLQYRKSHSIDAILGLRAAAAAVAVR